MALRFRASDPIFTRIPPDPIRLGAFACDLLESGGLFVADRGGRLIGLLGVIAAIDPRSGTRFATEIGWWVEPSARGSIAGVRLLRAGEEWARAHDCTEFHCFAPWTPLHNEIALVLEREGYAAYETAFAKRLI